MMTALLNLLRLPPSLVRLPPDTSGEPADALRLAPDGAFLILSTGDYLVLRAMV